MNLAHYISIAFALVIVLGGIWMIRWIRKVEQKHKKKYQQILDQHTDNYNKCVEALKNADFKEAFHYACMVLQSGELNTVQRAKSEAIVMVINNLTLLPLGIFGRFQVFFEPVYNKLHFNSLENDRWWYEVETNRNLFSLYNEASAKYRATLLPKISKTTEDKIKEDEQV
jgi:hypothetical protein